MPRPKNKDEYRAELAETFAHILEEQGLNWKKEWHGQGINAPYNAVTKAHYRGINAFWLSLVSMAKGYTDPRWVTMVQIMDNDGKYHPKESWHLKKGSKAAYVEYWYPYDLKEKKAVTWKQYKDALNDGRTEAEFKLSSRYYAVFNAQNVEGMPPLEVKQVQSVPIDQLVQTLSQNMGVPVFTDGGDRAYYSPRKDEIHLPKPESFFSEYAFNSTALHELAHSTGHASRLNRDLSGGFGSQAYAYEELVAEMCSAFMSADLAATATPEHIENHKAYVQSWIKAIREKPETLVKAIKDAQEAAVYMDSQAELIPEEENRKVMESAMEISEDKIRTPESDAVSSWKIVMVSEGGTKQDYRLGFSSEAEARRAAAAEGWKYVDENQFEWSLEVEEATGLEIPPAKEAVKENEPIFDFEGDGFSIYQVGFPDEQRVRFMGMDWLKRHDIPVDRKNYDLVYTAPLEEDTDLEDLYRRFNAEIPEDFRGASMNVSDVVVIKRAGEITCHFCDTIGFQEVPGFLPGTEAEKERPEPKQNRLTVLVVEPGKVPYPKQIPDTLQSLQQEVGGYIQAVYPFRDPVCVICNEETKLEGLPLNRSLQDEQGQTYDVVAGTFLVAGLGEENFTSLSPDLLDKYSRHFAMPEMFASLGGKIISMPMQEPQGSSGPSAESEVMEISE